MFFEELWGFCCVPVFLATALDPFFLQCVLGRTIALEKNAEDAGERLLLLGVSF